MHVTLYHVVAQVPSHYGQLVSVAFSHWWGGMRAFERPRLWHLEGSIPPQDGWYGPARRFQEAAVERRRSLLRLPMSGVTSFGPLSAPLHIITLKGFWRTAVNTSFVERRSVDGSLFIYWCPKESDW